MIFMKFILFALIPLILSIGITPAIPFDDASAIAYFPPPLKQISSGILPENVTCTEGLVIVLKVKDNSPACLKPASSEKLIQRGWASEISPITKDSRPNILVIVLDDVGFSDLGFTASEINTPVMNSLAENEILMTNFHVTPTCSPTRAVLLTGVDNHLNGFGTMNELLVDNQRGIPGYETYLNDDVVTIPTLLKDAGYHTFMSGKWHLSYGGTTKDYASHMDFWSNYDPYSKGFTETFSAALPGSHFDETPVTYGYEAFYNRNNERVTLPDDFYTTDDYTDYMIEFVDTHHSDDKPMFMYLAYWASHFPLHAPQEYIDRYDGVYEKGWDEIRKERFELQKELGLIPESTEFPPRWDKVPSWDELTPEEQAFQAKKMQVYAGMTENMDENIGRLIDHLKEIGEWDNTLLFIFSDNGAESADVKKKIFAGDSNDEYNEFFEQFDNSVENIGTDTSLESLGIAWAQVGSTPLYREKVFQTEGGTRVPMIVKLPNDSVNFKTNAFSHVQDLGPTILDYANVEHPGTSYNDHKIHPMDGRSIKPFLQGETVLIYDEDEPFGAELFGNKALYKGDWKALSLVSPFGDGWQLFNLIEDVGEQNDLSNEYPELLEEMIADFEDYEERVGIVYPEGLTLPR